MKATVDAKYAIHMCDGVMSMITKNKNINVKGERCEWRDYWVMIQEHNKDIWGQEC